MEVSIWTDHSTCLLINLHSHQSDRDCHIVSAINYDLPSFHKHNSCFEHYLAIFTGQHNSVTSPNHRGHCLPLKRSSVSNLRSLYCFSHTIAICQLCETISMTFFLPKHPVFSCICDTERLLGTEMLMNEEPAVTSVKPVPSCSRDCEKTFV